MGDHAPDGREGDMSAAPDVADDDRAQWLEKGQLLFKCPCEFVMGVVGLEHLPPADRVEIAFCGRSNVGKSSLLNALTGQKSLARTSNTPGRTQEINYFSLNKGGPGPLYLVDLPGYGYARAPKTEVERWTGLVKDYLKGRQTLRRVLLLIDARHGLKANDKNFMALMDVAAVSYQIVLTKLDKIKAGGREKLRAIIAEQVKKHPACYPEILATSSQKTLGLDEVKAEIAHLLEQ